MYFQLNPQKKIQYSIDSINLGKRELKVHKEQRHQDESIRTCHICQKVMSIRSELYKHYVVDKVSFLAYKCKMINFFSITFLQKQIKSE